LLWKNFSTKKWFKIINVRDVGKLQNIDTYHGNVKSKKDLASIQQIDNIHKSTR
jgi:hypothetical protein